MTPFLLAASLALAAPLRDAPMEKTLPAGIPTLAIEAGAGAVRVEIDPDLDQGKVTIQPLTWAEGCEVELGGDGARAHARVLREGEAAGLACRTRFLVTLPPGTELEVDLGAGRVRMEALADPVDVHVGFGALRLRYAEPPAGAVVASVGLGRLATHFPYGTWLDLEDTDARLGTVRSAIPARADAATDLDATAAVGAVRVRTILLPWEESPWREDSSALASAN